MKDYLFQYEDAEGTVITKVTSANEVVETYDFSDCNDCSNFKVWRIGGIDNFKECLIKRVGSVSVDEYDHFDIIFDIVDATTKEVYDTILCPEH